jgi:hypothetical protein
MAAASESLARRRLALVLLGLAAAAAAVIALFDPMRYAFYPGCPLSERTGLECAACGTLRALHAVTRARWAEAFAANPLAVVALPVAAAVLVNEARILVGRRSWRLPVPVGRTLLAVVALLLVYVVVRNLL